MKKWLFIALIFASCSPGVDRVEAPEKLIKKEKMVTLLTELMKLEGHVSIKYLQVDKYKDVLSTSADSLFNSHGVTKASFESSFEYYAQQQDDLRQIYEKVLDNLNHELTELELEEQNK